MHSCLNRILLQIGSLKQDYIGVCDMTELSGFIPQCSDFFITGVCLINSNGFVLFYTTTAGRSQVCYNSTFGNVR